jgi:hypothetical protein
MCPDGNLGFEWEAAAGTAVGVGCTGWPPSDPGTTGSDSNAGANTIFRLDGSFISGTPRITFIPSSPGGTDKNGARWRSLIAAARGYGMEHKILEGSH